MPRTIEIVVHGSSSAKMQRVQAAISECLREYGVSTHILVPKGEEGPMETMVRNGIDDLLLDTDGVIITQEKHPVGWYPQRLGNKTHYDRTEDSSQVRTTVRTKP